MKFNPMLTPKEMLHRGIFGGTYFSELIDHKDFPEDWFRGLKKVFIFLKNIERRLTVLK